MADDAIGDIFTTSSKDASNPLTGSMFFLDVLENPDPAPKYDYDETGVVLKGEWIEACQSTGGKKSAHSFLTLQLVLGELHVKDEQGNEATLLPGDTFFIHRGSLITFSTPRYAVAYKTACRHSH